MNIPLILAAAVLLLSSAFAREVKITSTTPPPTHTVARGKIVSASTPPPHADVIISDLDFVAFPGGAFCQIWDQDCPDGLKCIADSLDLEPRCRPLDNNPDQVGDLCSAKGNNDGDTCDVDGMCINGVCREICQGTPASPFCNDIKDVCHFYSGGTPLCEVTCNPLFNGVCPNDMYCSSTSTSPDQRFTCMSQEGPLGIVGDSCTQTSQCNQGLACQLKSKLPVGFCNNAGTLRCCAVLAEDEDDCPANTSLFDLYPTSPPPGLENLGICITG